MQVLQIYSPHISLLCISQEFRNQIIMNINILNFRMYTFNTSIHKISSILEKKLSMFIARLVS